MMNLPDYDRLFNTIQQLVMCHSPSGKEEEINQMLLNQFQVLGLETWLDEADNAIAKIPGRDSSRAVVITAHKDEIGGIVKSVDENGCLQIRKLGGSYPWIYGEGVVDLLGDRQTISGILCFGSRHVSHESPQKALQDSKALHWEQAWVETKCTLEELEAAGVRPGTRMVVGKHRKQPFRIKDYIGSYTLDNKASIAILLRLAANLKTPDTDVYLVASAKEEVGAVGALYFTQTFTQHFSSRIHQHVSPALMEKLAGQESALQLLQSIYPSKQLTALIALEICPLSSEYPLEEGEAPVLLSQDGYGLYDETLNLELQAAANRAEVSIQQAAISGFGSDASIAMKMGHVARGACLSFPTQNTHGYEIAHLGAIANCVHVLCAYCQREQLGDS